MEKPGSNDCCRRPPCWGVAILIIGLVIAVTLGAILVFVLISPTLCDTTETLTSTTSPSLKECGTVYMTYTLDDSGEVYADGVQIVGPIDDNWPAIGVVSIPCGTRVLAFRTLNSPLRPGTPCGVRALISNGIKTDGKSSWKCSDMYVMGWNMTGFDDRSWSETEVQSTNRSPGICGDCYTIGFGPRGSTGPGPYYIRLTLTG